MFPERHRAELKAKFLTKNSAPSGTFPPRVFVSFQIIAQRAISGISFPRKNFKLNPGQIQVIFSLAAGTDTSWNFTLDGVLRTVSYVEARLEGYVQLQEVADSLETGER